MRLRPLAAIVPVTILVAAGLAGCSAKTPAANVSGSAACPPVAKMHLYQPGQLTVATDSPAYSPWFRKNDPSNGQGYESAVAYAVAAKMGFARSQVHWVKERFNNSYQPGTKHFDFDINEISITADRQRGAEFSDGYYTAQQAVIALKRNAPKVATVAALKDLKLGAETATTSLAVIQDEVKPSHQPLVFSTDDQAKQALVNGQIDALVTDLPSAGYISEEIPGSTVVGKFSSQTPEQFGLLLQKGNPLVTCVNDALGKVRSAGTLTRLEHTYLASMEDGVPVLK
jgi:polar amino acid transport system substrate-binding protein